MVGKFGKVLEILIDSVKIAKCIHNNINIMCALSIQIAKYKIRQYQLRVTSPNLMLTKVTS